MNSFKKISLNKAPSKAQFKLLTSTAMVALALTSMSATAGPGKVCLENAPATATTPAVTNAVGTCTSGDIGTYYANSPKLRKFIDTLPGLTKANANSFGEYIPLAIADTTSYPGSEYFVIGVVEHAQKMHSDLAKPTTLRSYVQLYPQGTPATSRPSTAVPLFYPDGITKITWPGTAEQVFGYDKPHYLGPIILTTTGTPVRTTMVNLLPTGRASIATTTTAGVTTTTVTRNGDMFLPVDETLGGAGLTTAGDKYPQNRAAFHLHGGDSPWISDGTPHQWITPAADTNIGKDFKTGNRMMNVPDMPFPGQGSQNIFWPNDQTARLMWYHDHTFGLTRQNAYGGEAAGYVIMDEAEKALLGEPSTLSGTIGKAIPNGLLDQILLVIQDKTFVPADIALQDSKWDQNAWGKPGDLWYPHVYEPFELWGATAPAAGTVVPLENAGVNPAGRWDYALGDITGAYQPPTVGAKFNNPEYGQVAFPDGSYADGTLGKGPSATPESYMDTPVINGVAYPVLNVEPKAYRVRFLNGANDRYFNISLWQAATSASATDSSGKATATNTEVTIVPPGGLFADGVTTNTSNDPAGVPDPSTAGPSIIQFGNESGLLPNPVVHKPKLMGFNAAGEEIADDYFYLGSAERADTVIDFSQFAGQTLIMYNDGTAPVPGGDPRYDYYTGAPDQTPFGGAPTTQAGYGPNTRTLMQIRVASTLKLIDPVTNNPLPPAAAYDPAGNGGALATQLPVAYAATADQHIVAAPLAAADIDSVANTITINSAPQPLQIKTIHGFTDPNIGRLIAQLGTELPASATGAGGPTPLSYIDLPTEILNAGETQYWWIKNYDVDNHPMHFHLFNVQVLAHRSQADGSLRTPVQDEMGWKETVKNWPGEDLIVAVRPKTPALPFGLPNSVRALDPTLPAGATANEVLYATPTANVDPAATQNFVPFAFAQLDLDSTSATYGQSKSVANSSYDYGWEYVWHCHILGHEENDLMRPMVYRPTITKPSAPVIASVDKTGLLTWTDPTPAGGADAGGVATKGNTANEIGFQVQRVALNNNSATAATYAPLAARSTVVDSRVNTLANATQYQDTPTANTDYLYKVVSVNEGFTGMSASVKLSQAPAAPTGLTVTPGIGLPGNVLPVTLTWSDVATNEDGYAIGGAATGSTAANIASFTTANLGPVIAGKQLSFNVAATKAGFANSALATATLTVVPVLTAPTTFTAVTNALAKTAVLNWVDQAFAETGYQLKRSTVTINQMTGLPAPGLAAVRPSAATVLPTNATTVTDTALAANTLYQYQIFPMNGAIASTTPASLYATTAVNLGAAPAQLQAAGKATASSFGFQWQNTASTLATGYEVQQCLGTAAACTLAAATAWQRFPGNMTLGANSSQFVATGLTAKTTYSFRVRAVNTFLPKAVNGDPGLVSPWSKLLAGKTL